MSDDIKIKPPNKYKEFDNCIFENDELDREKYADNLEKIIDNTEDSFVLEIDSPWGTGKTTFIKMWENRIKKEDKYKTISFNAWENDYLDDPLAIFIGELIENVEIETSIKDKLKDKWKDLTKNLIYQGASFFTKIDFEKIEESLKTILEDRIENYQSLKESIDDFKEILEKINLNKSGEKIVFFIDELDRCRPDFAIEILEVAKHFFDVPGIVFVLAVDGEQLKHSLKTVYGQDMDTGGYLKKIYRFNLFFTRTEL